MKDVMFLNGDAECVVFSPDPSHDDVRIIVDGPRYAFAVLNQSNGMMLRFDDELAAGERLWIEARGQKCFRRVKGASAKTDATPAEQYVSVGAAQTGWGWMRLMQGRNVLKLLPL